MGGFVCRPQTEVTEDPDVAIYSEVGYCVLMGHYPGDFTQLSRFGGLAYIKKSGHLCIESTVGSRFCCLCCRNGYMLSDISQVDVVTGSVTVIIKDSPNNYEMNPGLRVRLNDGQNIIMKMPDAVDFCDQLRQYCNRPTGAVEGQPLHFDNLRWEPVAGQNACIPALQAVGGCAEVRVFTGAKGSGTLAASHPSDRDPLLS